MYISIHQMYIFLSFSMDCIYFLLHHDFYIFYEFFILILNYFIVLLIKSSFSSSLFAKMV